jgi:exodeoxyribonuclease V gamma subunit
MLYFHTSNRYEILRERLLMRLAQGPADPFLFQEVIVPSAAIRRDVQLGMAKNSGVAAGVAFAFLAEWLWRRIAQLVPDVAAESPFAPERAAWRFYRLFQDEELLDGPPRLANYLRAADPLMRLDLARHTARLFETYITYRPDWLEAWRRNESARFPAASARQDEAWQRVLWQRFTESLGAMRRHPAAVFFETLEDLGATGVKKAGLPAEAHLFALPSLPPLYLKILARLSEWMDFHVYLINPCQDYWAELVTQKRQSRLAAQGKEEYLDNRYPLLADWGRQTQALLGLILETVSEESIEEGHFQIAEGDALLRRFQNSLLNLEAPVPGAWPLAAEDRSVEIHVAHSLIRQLEILRDQLLARFEADASLEPGDVLVALPDLDTAAPLIDAVFGRAVHTDAAGRIPYVITGRKTARDNGAARVLLQLMDLAMPPARLPVSQVFALLREPLVAAALGLDDDDLERLETALQAAGAHWGLDAGEKEAAGLPGDARHTWRDALARLLLGYALPADGGPFAGIIPAGNLTGSRALVLGVLWQTLERLQQLTAALSRPHFAAGWRELWQAQLLTWLGEQPADPEAAESLRLALAALEALTARMMDAGPETPIPAAVARAALEEALETQNQGGIPTGSVTFAALPSLRYLPYRLICLLDLNDGVFPKPERPLEFDLTAFETRPGDRQRRQEARNLFLDLLLAARDMLYLSYTGKSQQDDSPLPPSILVAELREWLLRATGAPSERLCIQHPLQAFSPRYFDVHAMTDTRLESFNATYARALAVQAEARANKGETADAAFFLATEEETEEWLPAARVPRFSAAPLAPLTGERLTLAQLRHFFLHPAKSLLRERLGIDLPEAEAKLEDEEPLLLGGLERYHLAQRLLPLALSGASQAELLAQARAGVELPDGQIGEVLLREEVHVVARYAAALRPCLAELSPDALPLRLNLAGLELTGQLRDWDSQGLLRYRFAQVKAKDYIAAWLDHLCLNICAPAGVELKTRHMGRDASFCFLPLVDRPLERLTEWVVAWREGETHFYPQTSWEWASAGKTGAWQGSDAAPGEAQDPWRQLLLRGQADPLGADFQAVSQRLLAPLLQSLDMSFSNNP